MDQRAFERRLVEQRARLSVSPQQLLNRVERSGYGPKSKQILREHVRRESTGQVGFALFDCPPAIVRGDGALVWDADGKEYVDMLAGFSVSNTGHCHPRVVAAISEQAGRLMHYFDLPGEPRERLAARLTELAPGDHRKRVVFGVTGADAVELAVRLARWYTGAPIILSAYGGYHGTTGATADEVAASWGPGAHVATFAATALASAAANATLDVYESEQLVQRAAELGEYFLHQLEGLQERHPILGWIDARGLFIGLEFVRDRVTKEPAAEEAGWMLDFCVREGLLFEKGGYLYNRFQLIPSFVIEKEQIDRAVDILDRAMAEAEERSGIIAA